MKVNQMVGRVLETMALLSLPVMAGLVVYLQNTL